MLIVEVGQKLFMVVVKMNTVWCLLIYILVDHEFRDSITYFIIF